MATNVSICNTALDHLGHTTTIASFDEQSKEAAICRRHYDENREEVLRSHPWNFARKHLKLALKTEDDNTPPPGWEYAYVYPSDCLKAHAVVDESGLRSFLRSFSRDPVREAVNQQLKHPFQVMSAHDLQSRIIVTDLEDAILVYTANVTNTNLFGPILRAALSYRIASDIAMPISADPQVAQNALAMYERKIMEAKAHDMEEIQDDPFPESPSILARNS